MASRWAISTIVLALILAACRPPVQPSIKEGKLSGSKPRAQASKVATAPAAAPAVLTVTIQGPTPESLTLHGTKAAVGYVLAQAAPRYVPVPQAEVTVTDPAGRQLAGRGLRTDPSGAVKLPRIVSGAALVFVRAAYAVQGRRVTLSAAVPTPRADGTATVDPATTLVAKKLEMLGRMNIVDLNVLPPALPAQLAQALASRLTEEEVAAIGLLDPEPAARMLDTRVLRDAGLRDALTAAVGAGAALTAFLQPLPRTAPTPAPSGAAASGTPAPGGDDAIPTTLPTDLMVSLAPLTPEPTLTPFPVAVSAPPSAALSAAPSVAPSAAASVAASPSPSPSLSPSASPSSAASVAPSPEPSP